jgi:peptidoglycan hydrolase CwlO-like protein
MKSVTDLVSEMVREVEEKADLLEEKNDKLEKEMAELESKVSDILSELGEKKYCDDCQELIGALINLKK